ncbi:hypothetical protein [Clostridium brassicae]|uniref:Uncharacterized protein n=1 Tax=Clostridium brassicae TaxID=2999072 RepID=A0ABT4DEH4_9CLOT|nr:hypothetical protein [Clostridium brassicae]MCY6960719.1 hypothetical protein [Clostridium brassicae]
MLEALNTIVDHTGNTLAYTKDFVGLVNQINWKYIKVLYDIYRMKIME